MKSCQPSTRLTSTSSVESNSVPPSSPQAPKSAVSGQQKSNDSQRESDVRLRNRAVFISASWIGVIALWSFVVLGEPAGAADERVDYSKQIKPILRERCYACHGVLKQKGGLRLDTAALAIKGGDSGPVIEPGDVEASELVARVSATEESERMPPEGEPLKPEQIAAIRAWIAQNAEAPGDEQPERDPRDHWSFKQIVRPQVPFVEEPTAKQARWQRNPIDAFIAQGHRQHRLVPQAEANKRVWLRRVSLDLVGLPPSTAELDAFVADESLDAQDRVVTRLLESPQYGERWGRHWMDIWRYSDWWGFGDEVRNSQKHMWHFRDWIVESLNEDKGYDQMLREMFAADELYPDDLDKLRASGYLTREFVLYNRTMWLDQTIEHTSKAMLGLTMNCCKCHDHKYDPLSQVEYHSMRAIFEPYQVRTEMIPGQVDFEKDGISRAFDANPTAPTYLHVRGNEMNPDKSRVIEPAVPALLRSEQLEMKVEPVELPLESQYPGLRDFAIATNRDASRNSVADAHAAIEDARRKLRESEIAAKEKAAAEAQKKADAAAGKPAASAAPAKPADGKPTTPPPLPVDQAQLVVTIAEKSLLTAQAYRKSLEARIVADRAVILGLDMKPDVYESGPEFEGKKEFATKDLVDAAIDSENAYALAKAEEDLCRKELASLQDPNRYMQFTQKNLDDAIAALAAAKRASGRMGNAHTPVPGAKKTPENFNFPKLDSPFPKSSTGRRTAFAKWLTDPRNPLPARVAVNHIWSRHMGKPLVPTVFDFGRKGLPPTHPELLDWLASELIESDWSMKHLHRLIVTSEAYRLSSSSANADAATLGTDADNRYYWRMNPNRMDAQTVRDSVLSLSGEPDFTMGGPSVAVKDEKSRRRSLYFVHSYNDRQAFLSTFDDANVLDCYRRTDSIVPQQALALENSSFVTEMSGKILERLTAAHPNASDAEFVREAYVSILSTEPTAEEQATMCDLLRRLTEATRAKKRPNPEALARTNVIQNLLNLNDFITIR